MAQTQSSGRPRAGRPTDYNLDIAEAICTRIAKGEPLVRIARDDDMPHVGTVYKWLMRHPEFSDMYTRAREDQADTLADQIVDIADTEEDVNRGKLRVDARKWVAAKLKPRKYGEHKDIHLTGEFQLLTDAQIEKRLLGAAGRIGDAVGLIDDGDMVDGEYSTADDQGDVSA